jgi:chaperonin GroES
MKLHPIGGHLIVKPADAERATASGIIIPDTAQKERPERGEVIAMGPGKLLENGKREEMEVAVGDTVLFKKYAPDEVEVDGETYLIIEASDVMATLK